MTFFDACCDVILIKILFKILTFPFVMPFYVLYYTAIGIYKLICFICVCMGEKKTIR